MLDLKLPIAMVPHGRLFVRHRHCRHGHHLLAMRLVPIIAASQESTVERLLSAEKAVWQRFCKSPSSPPPPSPPRQAFDVRVGPPLGC